MPKRNRAEYMREWRARNPGIERLYNRSPARKESRRRYNYERYWRDPEKYRAQERARRNGKPKVYDAAAQSRWHKASRARQQQLGIIVANAFVRRLYHVDKSPPARAQ